MMGSWAQYSWLAKIFDLIYLFKEIGQISRKCRKSQKFNRNGRWFVEYNKIDAELRRV